MSNYTSGWRSGDAGGSVDWSEGWNQGGYAQQMKAGPGGSTGDYLSKFDALTKSDSSVDDEEGWRTVTNLRNNDSANIESIQKQAEEWKAQGFDVRVQDLDGSHGAEWADLAVRKTAGTPTAAEPEVISDPSDEIVQAKEKVQEYEQYRWSGQHADDLFHDSADTTGEGKYNLNLREQAKDSLLNLDTSSSASSNVKASDFADNYKKRLIDSGSPTQPSVVANQAATTVQGDTKWM